MSEAVYGPLITLAATILFGWLLVAGFRAGSMGWPYFGTLLSGRRRDQPIRFWLLTALLMLMTLCAALATIGQTLAPDGLGL